jgi:broad specificity phosphatase PhoE
MRVLEHRRHGLRQKGQPHLLQKGVNQARLIGASMGTFARVVTSPMPRAIETAVAMGYAVDLELAELATVPDAVLEEITQEDLVAFSGAAAAIGRNGEAAQFARRQAELWHEILATVPDGGQILMISHGGLIELGAVAAVPELGKSGGDGLSCLEGVRLELDGDRWARGSVLRLGPAARS